MKPLIVFIVLILVCQVVLAQNETPSRFEPTNDGFNYIRRTVMIPMRDGVKLHTIVYAPKSRSGPRRKPHRVTASWPGCK